MMSNFLEIKVLDIVWFVKFGLIKSMLVEEKLN